MQLYCAVKISSFGLVIAHIGSVAAANRLRTRKSSIVISIERTEYLANHHLHFFSSKMH